MRKPKSVFLSRSFDLPSHGRRKKNAAAYLSYWVARDVVVAPLALLILLPVLMLMVLVVRLCWIAYLVGILPAYVSGRPLRGWVLARHAQILRGGSVGLMDQGIVDLARVVAVLGQSR